LPPPKNNQIDKLELNVVKLLIRRKAPRFTYYALMRQMIVDAQGYYIKGGNA
jgi:hypothetical protein